MTETTERSLAAVPDETKKPKQPSLELGAPPRWSFQMIDVAMIEISGFGSPPEDGLVRSVETAGVLQPILLDPNGETTFKVRDGRRRLLAAIKCDRTEIPALILESGDPDLWGAALPLQANDVRAPNPIVELEAIEDLIRQVPGISLPTIAHALGVKLKTLRARIRLSSLRHELRDAWKAGKFGTKVGEGAARCDEPQQAELMHRLEANGTLTEQDVKDVRKIGVRTHQRTTTEDRKIPRAVEMLEKVRKDLFLELGGKHPAMVAIDEAIEALKDE